MVPLTLQVIREGFAPSFPGNTCLLSPEMCMPMGLQVLVTITKACCAARHGPLRALCGSFESLSINIFKLQQWCGSYFTDAHSCGSTRLSGKCVAPDFSPFDVRVSHAVREFENVGWSCSVGLRILSAVIRRKPRKSTVVVGWDCLSRRQATRDLTSH